MSLRAVAFLAARLVVVAALVTIAAFWMLDSAPGDPALQRAGFNATPERLEQIREELGLNDPFLRRYARWLGDAASGDFGTSVVNDQPVSSLLRTALPNTVEIMVLAQIMALAAAIPVAIGAAQRPGGLPDRVSGAVSFGFFAIPVFVLGIYLAFLFGVRLGWLPTVATDLPGLFEDPRENLRQLFLPSLTLALNLVAIYLRLLRTDLIDTLQQDYVLLAQARGFSTRRVLWRHALRPSSLGLLTAVGLNTAALIGGALVVEILFAVPGMGRLAIGAVFGEDYDVVMAVVLLLSVGFIVVNFVVDLLYSVIDPRIRRVSH